MTQSRKVSAEYGEIVYTLEKKKIKNLNMRLKRTGELVVSAPLSWSVERVDEFVCSKSDWILKHVQRREEQSRVQLLPELNREECAVLLHQAVERMYPLVIPYGVAMPEVKIRKMRAQWGNCHWKRGYITLNTALHRCPEHLRDYVALHELVHFIHHDHGAGFYATMDALMPDWSKRREQLNLCLEAIHV